MLSAKENITEDASGILIEGVLESMAEYYSAELSQKVRRGIRESLSKGYFIGGYKLLRVRAKSRINNRSFIHCVLLCRILFRGIR